MSGRKPLIDAAGALTALLAVAAIGLTVHGLKQTPQLIHQIRGREDRLRRVLELQQQHGNAGEQVLAFSGAERTMPAAIRAVLGNMMPDERVNVVDVEPRSLGHGVLLLRTDVQFEAVDLALLASFIERLEGYDPPWRMKECVLRAVSGQPGRAQARLVFEALEKMPGGS